MGQRNTVYHRVDSLEVGPESRFCFPLVCHRIGGLKGYSLPTLISARVYHRIDGV